jgi:hypothetical protein
MSYTRVIPRDLFNESKLLKCLGQLSLLIHDGKTRGVPLSIEHDDSDCPGFDIQQDGDRATLFVSNVAVRIDGVAPLNLGLPINARDRYPLELYTAKEAVIDVFNSDGSLSVDFIDHCKELIDA